MLKVRHVEERDRDLLNAAALADPYHAAIGLTGDYWKPADSILYEDAEGPVVALKTQNIVRSDIQFLTQNHERNSRALYEGFWTYVKIMQARHVREIIFNTQSPDVTRFFQRRFHFAEVKPITMSLRID